MSADNWKKGKPQEETEDWLVTYADAITLLMAFFIIFFSISKVDKGKFDQMRQGIGKDILRKETILPMQELKVDIQDIVYTLKADEAVKVTTDSEGVVLEFASGAFYKSGTAELNEAAYPLLNSVAQTILSPKYANFSIEVEGHTDDDPISTLQYPSNWELSAGRASRVVRHFIEQGIVANRQKAVGYAATIPKVPNRTPEGVSIPENKEANRRVVVRLKPQSNPEGRFDYEMPSFGPKGPVVDVPQMGTVSTIEDQ